MTPLSKITLRDIDNRDGDGTPYEFTGGPEQVVGYIDGAVRGDLRDPSVQGAKLDTAIKLIRAGNLPVANQILNRDFAVYLHWETAEQGRGCCG